MMFKNYVIIALRNLARNKIYSFINIAGLSIGLACAMLILLYVKDEVSFDKFHSNVNHIYRIVTESSDNNGDKRKDPNTGYLQGPRFKQHVPGIQSFVRLQEWYRDIRTGSEIQSQRLLYVDTNFFSVFTFPLLNGDAISCLKTPASVVISEDVAERQFGTKDAVGKIIMLKKDTAFAPYEVTAVAKRCPQNSSIQFDVLMPFQESAEEAKNDENWFNFMLNTFVVVNPKASVPTVEKAMQDFFVKDAGETYKKLEQKYGDIGGLSKYSLQPYTDMHLSTDLSAQNGLYNASNPMYSYLLTGIALFVLLIACINFVNLTVARSVRRAKEIGIRKVVGGDRKQLVFQFLGESFLLCFIAFLLALLLVQFLLPLFNNLSNKVLALSYLFDGKLIAAYMALFFFTGLLAGWYPALVLSGYNPVETLYSRFTLAGKNYLQKSLVVLQFALASFLIIATFSLYAQFSFLTKTALGYDDSNLIVVNKDMMNHNEAAAFKTELMKHPDIVSVAPKNGGIWGTRARNSKDSTISFAYETVNESYLPTLQIPLKEGRNFSSNYPSDSNNSVIVNESFVKEAGWQHPLGEAVNFWYQNKVYHVIGVVKDYHYAALNEKIKPQLFTMKHDNPFGTFHIKIKPGSETKSLADIQQTFRRFFPVSPYSYVFKKEQNRQQYEAEAKWKQIILFGAVLTIFISCIGLFGLSVLSAEKRIKEIGIRKILGASVNSIVTSLSGDFIKLVLIALLLSIPLAWLSVNKWLENYPYRITLSPWLFFFAGLLVIIIAMVTVSFQAVNAALMNPVKSLRSE